MKTPARLALATALGALLLPARPAHAASASQNFQVTATVAKECTITASDIGFGTYDPVTANDAAPIDTTGTINVRCTKGTAYTVGLSQGGNYSGGRRMIGGGGADYLSYELYTDNAGGTLWGTSAPNLVGGTAANKAAIPLTVYARLPGNQDVPQGSYADTVAAIVNF
jgi:spore coat protein U-like protein